MSAKAVHAGANAIVIALAALVFTLCAGCGTRSRAHVPAAPPRTARIGSTETGIASWYGNPYNGRRAASGEIFDMEQLTAAHRTLPFNTWIEVTNLTNGKQVDVRITDRGPFIKGRIVDLSLRAAREIDMIREGIVRVRIKVIAAPVQVTPTPAVAPAASPDVAPVVPPVDEVRQFPDPPGRSEKGGRRLSITARRVQQVDVLTLYIRSDGQLVVWVTQNGHYGLLGGMARAIYRPGAAFRLCFGSGR